MTKAMRITTVIIANQNRSGPNAPSSAARGSLSIPDAGPFGMLFMHGPPNARTALRCVRRGLFTRRSVNVLEDDHSEPKNDRSHDRNDRFARTMLDFPHPKRGTM